VGLQAERAHLILKGFMRHFPFILTTQKDARTRPDEQTEAEKWTDGGERSEKRTGVARLNGV